MEESKKNWQNACLGSNNEDENKELIGLSIVQLLLTFIKRA